MNNLIFRILALWVTATFSLNASFETSQLPLSDKLQKSFPSLNTSCFVISNTNCNIVVHERNSDKKINTGTFDEFVFSEDFQNLKMHLSKIGVKDSDFIKTENSFSGESKSTLHDMCCIFNDKLKSSKKTEFIKNISGMKICFFKSAMSGIGCAFKYKNKENCEFVCVLYGESCEENSLRDAKSIIKWLDQFFVFNALENESVSIKIPILYGSKNDISFDNSGDCFVMLSKKHSKQVNKIFRYRTLMKAPVNFGDNLGFVLYLSDIFKNPIVKVIKSKDKIEKSNGFKCVIDSILYAIFGSTAYKVKSKDLD